MRPTIADRIETAISAACVDVDTFTFAVPGTCLITLRVPAKTPFTPPLWRGTAWDAPRTHAAVDAWVARALSEIPTRYHKEGPNATYRQAPRAGAIPHFAAQAGRTSSGRTQEAPRWDRVRGPGTARERGERRRAGCVPPGDRAELDVRGGRGGVPVPFSQRVQLMRPACSGSWHAPRYKVALYRYAGGSEFWLCADCARVAVAFGAEKVKTNKEGL